MQIKLARKRLDESGVFDVPLLEPLGQCPIEAVRILATRVARVDQALGDVEITLTQTPGAGWNAHAVCRLRGSSASMRTRSAMPRDVEMLEADAKDDVEALREAGFALDAPRPKRWGSVPAALSSQIVHEKSHPIATLAIVALSNALARTLEQRLRYAAAQLRAENRPVFFRGWWDEEVEKRALPPFSIDNVVMVMLGGGDKP